MTVSSSAVNFCAPLFYPVLEKQPLLLLATAQQMLQQNGLPKATYVYIGSEGCDILLLRHTALFLKIADLFHEEGLAVTLVLPPVAEEQLEAVCEFLTEAVKVSHFDEIVCNDVGMLLWCSHHLSDCKRRAGRCFDKTVREARFDLYSVPNLQNSREVLPYAEQSIITELFRDCSVSGIDIDTVPGAVLQLPEVGRDYAIWYPETILSYSTTCEFAGSKLPASGKFLVGHCCMECKMYKTTVQHKSFWQIEKNGRIIEAIAPQPLQQLVNGKGRAVVSIRQWSEQL